MGSTPSTQHIRALQGRGMELGLDLGLESLATAHNKLQQHGLLYVCTPVWVALLARTLGKISQATPTVPALLFFALLVACTVVVATMIARLCLDSPAAPLALTTMHRQASTHCISGIHGIAERHICAHAGRRACQSSQPQAQPCVSCPLSHHHRVHCITSRGMSAPTDQYASTRIQPTSRQSWCTLGKSRRWFSGQPAWRGCGHTSQEQCVDRAPTTRRKLRPAPHSHTMPSTHLNTRSLQSVRAHTRRGRG